MTNSMYSKTNPFLATIKERSSLCKPGSKKNTQHLVLDLKGSGITYNVGDSIAIFPQNDPRLVQKTLNSMKASGFEKIIDKRTQKTWVLRDFLTNQANITEIHHKIVAEISLRYHQQEKREVLEKNKNDKQFLETHQLWDILDEHPDIQIPPQELCDLLLPLLPRFYSISSSCQSVGEEIHITVALLRYETNGHERLGVCTNYLCHLATLNTPTVPIYIQPHRGFTLPEQHNTPIIMIGPGTGVAPFRAFMQEREAKNASGKNWLFFGEWNHSTDFFYEDFWKGLAAQDKLRIETAFSRDQAHKIYVQHRMLEHGKELYRWIDEGAHLYVCGDAKRMAKDVEGTLLQIIKKHGDHDEQASKQYLKRLRTEKRYLRDVY